MRRSSGPAACRIAHERRGAVSCLHVLDLLGRLPEEEVGTDGGAEDADDHGGGVGIRRETGPDRAQRHLTPGNVNREQDRGVGQQGERQPLQEEDVTMIGDEHLQQQRSEHEERRHEMAIEAGDELRDFPHGGDVGGDVEGIGDQQQQHDAVEHDRRERGLDVGGKSLAGDPADARAHGLDRGHQREGQRHRPQHVEAELRARLGVGGDAAWIVVGHAGDKPRPDPRQRVLLQATPKDPKGVHALQSVDVILREPHAFRFRRLEKAPGSSRRVKKTRDLTPDQDFADVNTPSKAT